ncbi:MAG: SDR family NAD(P)-dependent oxidoreductase, partial [Pseudomonadota bacterium]
MTPGAALITGASKRLGRAMALDLAATGWDIVIHYNSGTARAEEVAQECASHGVTAVTLGADLLSEKETAGLVSRAVE